VATVDESRKALFDGPKERIKSAEVAHILDHSPLSEWLTADNFGLCHSS
jgi:hypothetical protein